MAKHQGVQKSERGDQLARVECERVGMSYFQTAPCKVVASQEIAATPERIFEVFLDSVSWTRWAFPILGVDWTSPFPLQVGSTRTVSMRGGMTGWEEFIAWEPGSRMAFRFNQTIKGGPEAFAEDYVVTDLGNGRSRVDWTMAMTFTGGSKRMSPVIQLAMRPMNAHMLRKFRKYVEADPVLPSATVPSTNPATEEA
ncbi:unannotated protein [freshwater metagenome]|uniref:Unannotated protein n=1 Tax=freshwater metagenome TaxID=449393 RepID=A0A6J6ATI0_9ZZZZ|nr:SRPBCC family protein [Actinomycetota bacterium]MSY79938.1 SRPBCC family protein [Actinomycetota bacterium]MTA62806.1 SRPBCC family protein [Actinomycetota bacterium]